MKKINVVLIIVLWIFGLFVISLFQSSGPISAPGEIIVPEIACPIATFRENLVENLNFSNGCVEKMCQNMKKLPEKTKNAVVVLMYGDVKQYFEETLRWVTSFYRFYYRFSLENPPDVIIFHSTNFPQKERENLQNAVQKMPLIFVPIDIDFPPNKKAEFSAIKAKGDFLGKTCWPKGVPWDYLSMGRFFSKLWFTHNALASYDYVWRLDGNLYFQRPIFCDIFEAMRLSDSIFGFYSWRNTERPGCQGNLREISRDYARKLGKFPNVHFSCIDENRLFAPKFVLTHYSGGFTVFRWDFWRENRDFLAFADHVDSLGITYENRVGEQVFYANALAIFAPISSIHQFGGLGPFIHRSEEMWGKLDNIEHVQENDPFCKNIPNNAQLQILKKS